MTNEFCVTISVPICMLSENLSFHLSSDSTFSLLCFNAKVVIGLSMHLTSGDCKQKLERSEIDDKMNFVLSFCYCRFITSFEIVLSWISCWLFMQENI